MNLKDLKAEYERINSHIQANDDLNTSIHHDNISRQLNRHEIAYLLQHWYYYEHNLMNLSKVEMSNAKALFYRLSYLTNDDRDVLAYMYHYAEPAELRSTEEIGQHFHLKSYDEIRGFKNSYLDKLKLPKEHPYVPDEDDRKHDRIAELFDELNSLMSD